MGGFCSLGVSEKMCIVSAMIAWCGWFEGGSMKLDWTGWRGTWPTIVRGLSQALTSSCCLQRTHKLLRPAWID